VPTLIESELFGYEKGAFTGASSQARIVQSANGGAIFLDEIGELPLELQAQAAARLQEKEVRPVGVPAHQGGCAGHRRHQSATSKPPTRTEPFAKDLYFR